jgi:cytochrome c peroxidase
MEYPKMDYPADNGPDLQKADLGRQLFFDPILSLDSSLSCASCHKPEIAFADNQAVSPGVGGALGKRNSPSLWNIGYGPYFMREGGVPTLEMQVLVPLQDEAEMHHNIVDAVNRLNLTPYRDAFMNLYGDSITPYLLVRALANYERTLINFDAPVDGWISGVPESVSKQSRRGAQLFYGKAGCNSCHSGVLFTDFSFANNGTQINDSADLGRERHTSNPNDRYLFKVPSLRFVAQTAPYMHDGSVGTLREVLDQYNEGGTGHDFTDSRIEPLGLTNSEIQELVAFLESL